MPLDASAAAQARADVATCDVLVIGGGPAGSTAATLLAQRGRRVVLLEKDRHPRFHIGESLLPQNLRIFDRLGIRDAVAALGVLKPGARFVSDDHGGKASLFHFSEGIDPNYTYAFQVRRSEFDALLFRRAAEAGAETLEEMRVLEVELDALRGHRVTARDALGRERHWIARHLIDASGRDTFLAQRLQSKAKNLRHNTAAIYGHFRGVLPVAGEAEQDGNITVHLYRHGWFWTIPLPDRVMSVGVVGSPEFFKRRKGSFEQVFREAVAESPSLAARMAGAERIGELTATGNYSYRSSIMQGDGWLMVGDAYAFVDPIFSSGVLLAMASAEMGAEAADAWLDDPRAAAPKIAAFEAKVRRAVRTFSWLIYRMHDPVLRDMFMSPRQRFGMQRGLVSLLAGNVHANADRQVPVLAFKTAYYMLKAAARLGFRLRDQGMVRIP
jgi:flavin-dependent dehydrogenase